MVTTRSRESKANGAEASQDRDAATGSKHKLSEVADSGRGKKAAKKEQKTLEETLNQKEKANDSKPNNTDENTNTDGSKFEQQGEGDKAHDESKQESRDESSTDKKTEKSKPETEAQPESHSANGEHESKSKSSDKSSSQDRAPSSILEKGIIYFFFRGRVNTDEPASVNDIARTFIMLRPLASPADELKAETLPNNVSRLIAVPKKVLPTSGRDRFISFVEKTGVSFADLKDSFLSGNEYETKTRGTQHTPAATPVGEGVYALTTTGRESHLAYLLTIPEELGEVQKELGLKDRGSFIISTRNPEYPPPGNASLPDAPEFPAEIKEEFAKRRWCPSNPKHLDIEGAQVLLIGESGGFEKATEPERGKDTGEGSAKEELEKLEEEDEERMESLGKDDSESIFQDLHASAKDYPKLATTF